MVCMFVLVAGVIADGLLPRVNEAAILAVVSLTALGTMAGLAEGGLEANGFTLATGLLVPIIVALVLAFHRRAFSPVAKAVIYLCYLFALLYSVYLGGADKLLNGNDLRLTEGLVFGGVSIFVLLHSMFAIRFFLIVSSLVFRRNRPLVAMIMPRLFSDEQVCLRRVAMFLPVMGAAVIANAWLHFVEPHVLLTIMSMVCVQFLFRSENT
jgi:hypothetical protein